MSFVRTTIVFAGLLFFMPQLAEACMVTTEWSQQDIAFADVIFEGSLTDVQAVTADEAAVGRDFFIFTFDVKNVVRGELLQDEILVGWMQGGHAKKPELTVETLRENIGDLTRVAISTPQFANLFCERKLVHGSSSNKTTGEVIFGKSRQLVCDSRVASLKPAFRENIPFVLSNGYVCGRSYFFPVQRYEDMQNYEKNYAAYKEALEKARKEARATKEGRAAFQARGAAELYREMVPEEPLMWKVPQPTAGNYAVNLVRDYKIFFTPALKDNAALQEAVLDLGIAIARYDIPRAQWNRPAWFDRDEATRADFREDLRREILRLVNYMEKDSNFRTRLLLDD